MSQARILIAGDLVPTESNYGQFERGYTKELLGIELLRIWEAADYRIINLEAPLIDGGTPIEKSGPNLSVPTRCFAGLKGLRVSCAVMANNHIMDYGSAGLESTIELLETAGIQHTGVGVNRREAEDGIFVELNGLRIGIYACSEHEFSAAGIHTPGANAIGINTCLKIAELKRKTDFVITLFHGGKEHYPYPTPEQRDRCRSFIDAGADVVVCQHSHCVGCEELYRGRTIVYGQGNFIFDYKNNECWKTGLLIELLIAKENGEQNISVTYHPICKNGNVIKYADDTAAEQIRKGFSDRGRELNQIEDIFRETAEKEGAAALRYLAGWGRGLRGIDRFLFKGALIKRNYSGKRRVLPLGVMLCETHLEIIKAVLMRKEDG